MFHHQYCCCLFFWQIFCINECNVHIPFHSFKLSWTVDSCHNTGFLLLLWFIWFFFRKQKGLCPYLLLYISKLKKSTQKVRSEEKRKKLVLSDKSVAILLFEGNNLLSQCRTRANSCKKLDLYFWIVGSTLLKSYHFLRSICSMTLVSWPLYRKGWKQCHTHETWMLSGMLVHMLHGNISSVASLSHISSDAPP